MYGFASWKHTPGMPDMNAKIKRLSNDYTHTGHKFGKPTGQRTKTGKSTYDSKSKKAGLKYAKFSA